MSASAFWARVAVGAPEACWLWLGFIERNGYGKIRSGGINRYAHRWSYELKHGAVPSGQQVDHLCRNRACVNPAHLEAVTQQENIRRGEMHLIGPRLAAQRTHCPHGHAYDEANTYWRRGWRQCRACKRNYCRNHKRSAA